MQNEIEKLFAERKQIEADNATARDEIEKLFRVMEELERQSGAVAEQIKQKKRDMQNALKRYEEKGATLEKLTGQKRVAL